ncbi:MAG: DUF4278 domain-containing protein [Cyanobacteria bacterium P01_E01_bin.6]
MRLSYCGLPYDYEPPSLDNVEAQLNRNYLRRNLNFAYPRHVPIVQSTNDLQRRGIAYLTETSGLIQPQIPTAEKTSSHTHSSLKSISMRQHKQIMLREVANQHRVNIQHRLQHRLTVARAHGNQGLIAQLEREMHQMT